MTDPDDAYLDGVFGGGKRPAWSTGRAVYEDAAVRRLCARLALPRLPRLLAAETEKRTGTFVCSWAMFRELTRFPVQLTCGRLKRVRFITVPDLFNTFHRTPIGLALADVCHELDPADAPIGLVFKWGGLRGEDGRQYTIKGGKFMIAHTAPASLVPGGVMLSAAMKLCHGIETVVVQRFDDFLADYTTWSYDAP